MNLTRFRTLGRSGLVVSPLALGTMTFGTERWGADEEGSRAIFRAYREAGGNVVDTADIYAGGAGEEIVGRLIAETGSRDEVVLATKFGFNAGASPLAATSGARRPGAGGNPNAGGNGAKNIHRALEGSLRRLGTDRIDLYWMHVWDGVTPVEEIVQTLGDLQRAGKILHFAFSDMPAWVAAKAATIASERRVPGPIAMQVEYSLVARDVEREHVPLARESGLGVMPWSPLAGGFLSGKYRREDGVRAGRLGGANPFGDSKFTDRNWALLDVVRAVAGEVGRSPAQVALAWLMAQPGVTSILAGASRVEQIEDAIAACDLVLDEDQQRRLTEASAPAPGFSDSLTAAPIRRMVFGGHDVSGWGEA